MNRDASHSNGSIPAQRDGRTTRIAGGRSSVSWRAVVLAAVVLDVAVFAWVAVTGLGQLTLAGVATLIALPLNVLLACRFVLDRRGELGQLAQRFDELGARLRGERDHAQQRETLLETVLGATSLAVLLHDENGTIVYANDEGRALLSAKGDGVVGRSLEHLVTAAPAPVREALTSSGDVLFTLERDGQDEVFQLSRADFDLGLRTHTLLMFKPLTRELARKESETWKKAIRVISNELNDSLTPLSSLVHSARLIHRSPEHAPKLAGVLDAVDERATRLRHFLDEYGQFARLPAPRREWSSWDELLANVYGLYPFTVAGGPAGLGHFDPSQMQQVLAALVKNAVEAGSPAEEVVVAVRPCGKDTELVVVDRGRGMTVDELRDALLPFYSTKKTGAGLGLSLCREIIHAHGGSLALRAREGGGVVVRCSIPSTPAVSAGAEEPRASASVH